MDVLKLAGGFYAHFFAAKTDDDFSDRLNYRYTLALLMSAAVFVGIVQFSSDVNNKQRYVSFSIL